MLSIVISSSEVLWWMVADLCDFGFHHRRIIKRGGYFSCVIIRHSQDTGAHIQ